MLYMLSRELHEIVLKRLHVLQSGELSKMLREYNENLFCRNKTVKLKKGNIVFETEIRKSFCIRRAYYQRCYGKKFWF